VKSILPLLVGLLAVALMACSSDIDRGLLESAAAGDVGRVKQLIALGANLNVRDFDHGGTPLIQAAKHGHVEAAKLLVSAGADLDLQDGAGSALYWACFRGNEGVANYLGGIGGKLIASKAALALYEPNTYRFQAASGARKSACGLQRLIRYGMSALGR